MDTNPQPNNPTPLTVPSHSHTTIVLIIVIAFVIIVGVLVGTIFRKPTPIPYPEEAIHLRDSIINQDRAKIDLLQQEKDKISLANAALIQFNIAAQNTIDRRNTNIQNGERQKKNIKDRIGSPLFNTDSVVNAFKNYTPSND